MENEDKKTVFEMNELADEELELIAKTKVDLKENDDHSVNDAHKFIIHFEVKEGDTRVPSFMIYERYAQWKESLGLKPQHKNMFLKDWAKFFKGYKDPYFKYYKLDPTPFDLSTEAFEMHRKKQNVETAKTRKAKEKTDKYKKIVQEQEKSITKEENQD